MSATLKFWIMRETEKARLYSTVPLGQMDRGGRGDGNRLWVPKSIIEHTTKRGDEHEVTLPDWFIEREGL